jgi:hypothetical protein
MAGTGLVLPAKRSESRENCSELYGSGIHRIIDFFVHGSRPDLMLLHPLQKKDRGARECIEKED